MLRTHSRLTQKDSAHSIVKYETSELFSRQFHQGTSIPRLNAKNEGFDVCTLLSQHGKFRWRRALPPSPTKIAPVLQVYAGSLSCLISTRGVARPIIKVEGAC